MLKFTRDPGKIVRTQQWLTAHSGTGAWEPSTRIWNSKTWISSARVPSHSPQDKTSKEDPRVAVRAGQESRFLDKFVVTGHSWDQAVPSVSWSGLGLLKHGCDWAGDQHSYSVSGAGAEQSWNGLPGSWVCIGKRPQVRVVRARWLTGALKALTKPVNALYGILGSEAAGRC